MSKFYLRHDAGLRDVPCLLRVGDEHVVSLLGELSIEECDADDGLHGPSFHTIGFEEGGDLLVGYFSLGCARAKIYFSSAVAFIPI